MFALGISNGQKLIGVLRDLCSKLCAAAHAREMGYQALFTYTLKLIHSIAKRIC